MKNTSFLKKENMNYFTKWLAVLFASGILILLYIVMFVWIIPTKHTSPQNNTIVSEDIVLENMKVMTKKEKPLVKVVQYNVTLQKENETITARFSKENYDMLQEGTIIDVKIDNNGRATILKFPTLQK